MPNAQCSMPQWPLRWLDPAHALCSLVVHMGIGPARRLPALHTRHIRCSLTRSGLSLISPARPGGGQEHPSPFPHHPEAQTIQAHCRPPKTGHINTCSPPARLATCTHCTCRIYMPYARTHTDAYRIHRARPILHPLSFHFGHLVSPFPSFMIHSNQTYPKPCRLIITNPVGVQSRSVHTSSSLVSTFVLSIIPRSTPNSRWFHLSSDCHWEPPGVNASPSSTWNISIIRPHADQTEHNLILAAPQRGAGCILTQAHSETASRVGEFECLRQTRSRHPDRSPADVLHPFLI